MKLSEMREKSVDELQGAIADWKKQLLESRIQLATNKLQNTSTISKTKRLIAQAKTVITEKTIPKEVQDVQDVPKLQLQRKKISNKV